MHVDLDHLWSFNKLNFWQDTVRKDVRPKDYLKNLEKDLDSYFIFENGKELAHTLLKERSRCSFGYEEISITCFQHLPCMHAGSISSPPQNKIPHTRA
jgi:hypothetical protein